MKNSTQELAELIDSASQKIEEVILKEGKENLSGNTSCKLYTCDCVKYTRGSGNGYCGTSGCGHSARHHL